MTPEEIRRIANENKRLKALFLELAEMAEYVIARQRGAVPALKTILERDDVVELRRVS